MVAKPAKQVLALGRLGPELTDTAGRRVGSERGQRVGHSLYVTPGFTSGFPWLFGIDF